MKAIRIAFTPMQPTQPRHLQTSEKARENPECRHLPSMAFFRLCHRKFGQHTRVSISLFQKAMSPVTTNSAFRSGIKLSTVRRKPNLRRWLSNVLA
jgi:hypothetical protein